MRKVILEVLNQAIKNNQNDVLCEVLAALGNNGYVVFYDLKGFIKDIKKAKLEI